MLLTTALMVLLQLDLGFTRKPINIYWNSTNTLFSSSQEPSIDVNSDQSASAARQFDQINLICPSGRRNREMHIIYSVTRGNYTFYLCFAVKHYKGMATGLLNIRWIKKGL